ncbi:hypothetical protein [Varibaculum cambriense]|uniref:hypothetical protein n=2 Tax=Varibaculum cambriense TaxID=184870 RepID=UPI00290A2E28|nr:hypothetical protein [Varibaculum cambriense]MDU4243975.1 hypothetical protein [Varibaculum cambriense]MDU5615241.1 hypothetical protein [Varibaculum cambriense]MDU7408004.1 hypothetical protein [Varibaculum cambriense]
MRSIRYEMFAEEEVQVIHQALSMLYYTRKEECYGSNRQSFSADTLKQKQAESKRQMSASFDLLKEFTPARHDGDDPNPPKPYGTHEDLRHHKINNR